MRQACGSNQHPDPKQFIQIYRLLSCYSLIKPPRGSNVSGGEMLRSLIDIQINSTAKYDQKMELELKLDQILDNGNFEMFNDHSYVKNEIAYNIDKTALAYFVGYVARNAKKHAIANKCTDCFNTLITTSKERNHLDTETQHFINSRSKGYLFHPSEPLMSIVFSLETSILNVLQNQNMNKHILENG